MEDIQTRLDFFNELPARRIDDDALFFSEGVPAVVSHAVEWAPESWKAHPDEIGEIARIGCALLASPTSAEEGLRALERYATTSLDIWKRYLGDDPGRLHR